MVGLETIWSEERGRRFGLKKRSISDKEVSAIEQIVSKV